MNILIRNFTDKVDTAEISAMIQVYTNPEYYDKIPVESPITIKDQRKHLKSPTVIVTKQGNGNLCFEFKEEK